MFNNIILVQNIIRIKSSVMFYKLAFNVPEILLKMIDIPDNSKPYFGLYYSHKPTFTDGGYLFNFSYYDLYEPFIKHSSIQYELHKASKFFEEKIDFGSDDSEPTYLLLINREDKTVEIAKYKDGIKFLRNQYPPVKPSILTEEQKNKLVNKMEAELANLKAKLENNSMHGLRKRGMFEMFTSPSIESQLSKEMLIREMDKQIGDELINLYVEYFKISYEEAKQLLTSRTQK